MPETPLYEQVRETILRRIILGEWPVGHVLPSEMELAEALGVSYGTVRRAMADLVQQAVIMRRQRVGTVVTGRSTHNKLAMFYHYFRMHHVDGRLLNSVTEPISTETRPMTAKEQDLFRPASDPRALHINRLRLTEGAPTMLDHLVVPAELAQPIVSGEVETPTLLYKWLLENSGIRISAVREEISATIATEEQARILKIQAPPPHALLEISEVVYDHRNRPVATGVHFAWTENHRYVNEIR